MSLDRRTYRWFYDTIACHYYNLAMKYCFLPFGGEARCRAELVAPVDFLPGERILDMCCGTGGATRAIAGRASTDSEIIGVDLSHGQIRTARKRTMPGNVTFAVADAACTSFEDACFDKVFVTHALHEMTADDRLRVLAEALRVLRKGGEIIVLELDNPPSLLVRLFVGLYLFYWLPFNFETSTRRDMVRRGVVNEMTLAGYQNVKKTSKYRGVFQTVVGEK